MQRNPPNNISGNQKKNNIEPVERVGEYCVAEADGGGEYVDGRDTGAPHYAGLVP